MDEEVKFNELDTKDATPYLSGKEDQSITYGEDNNAMPGNDYQSENNTMRDTDAYTLQESVSENKEAQQPFVSVQYNHKIRNFTKEEAINHIQKGLHTEGLRAKLEYLAKQRGMDVNSFVDSIVLQSESEYREYLEDMYGEDDERVEIGMRIYREQQSKEYKKLMAESEENRAEQEEFDNVNSRLANQYLVLKNEIPNAPDYNQLPDSVIVEAAEGKRDLYSAYLHYLYKEKMKIEAAQKTQETAKSASAGKMNDSIDGMTSSDRNFLAGLWSK